MTIKLVSTNDHPRPAYHDTWAEHLQADEQTEANSIAAFVADRIVTFVAGAFFCLVSEIALFYAKGVLW